MLQFHSILQKMIHDTKQYLVDVPQVDHCNAHVSYN